MSLPSSHHSHSHSHSHSHLRSHSSAAERTLIAGIILNILFVVLETGYGLWSHSLALLADAGHNVTDIIALVITWLTGMLARRAPSERFTYGLGGSTFLAALSNALLLLVVVGGIAWEAIERLFAAPIIPGFSITLVAVLGILVNGGTAWLLRPAKSEDLNLRGAYLHMLGDAAVSAGVVIAGIAIAATGSYWIDPLTSLIIILVIIYSTWGLLRDSIAMMLGAVPAAIDRKEVKAFLLALPGVTDIHDLHIWPLSTRETALTAHLIMPEGHPGDSNLTNFAEGLKNRFGIGHSTLQVETNGAECPLASDDVI